MGWTYLIKTPTFDARAEVASIMIPHPILQHSQRGSVHYLAVQLPDSSIIGVVVLTQQTRTEFGSKDMSENMGPSEAHAPKSLIAKLTPTENPYALDWRQRCLANAQPVTKLGKFELPEPLSFNNGEFTAQRFEKVKMKGYRSVYRDLDSGKVVRLSRHNLEGATPYE